MIQLIRALLKNLLPALKTIFAPLSKAFTKEFPILANILSNTIGSGLGAFLNDFLGGGTQEITEAVNQLDSTMKENTTSIVAALNNDIVENTPKVNSNIINASSSISDLLSSMDEVFRPLSDKMKELFDGLLQDLANSVGRFVSDLATLKEALGLGEGRGRDGQSPGLLMPPGGGSGAAVLPVSAETGTAFGPEGTMALALSDLDTSLGQIPEILRRRVEEIAAAIAGMGGGEGVMTSEGVGRIGTAGDFVEDATGTSGEDGFNGGINGGGKDINAIEAEINNLALSFENSISGSLRRLIVDGDFSFKQLGQSLKSSLLNSLADLAMGEHGFGGIIKGIVGGIFGVGTRATGGHVSAGMPYVVGEKAPEIFVPHSTGRIMPAHDSRRAMAGGGVTVQQNLHFETRVKNDMYAAIAEAAPLIEERARAATLRALEGRRI